MCIRDRDPKGRDDILEQIAYLHRQTDMTVILVSHSMEDIARYADRIIVMNQGEVLYNDTPRKVFAHYQELEQVGLAAPQVTYIMHDLKEQGSPVSVDVTTVEEAAQEIMKAMEKEARFEILPSDNIIRQKVSSTGWTRG